MHFYPAYDIEKTLRLTSSQLNIMVDNSVALENATIAGTATAVSYGAWAKKNAFQKFINKLLPKKAEEDVKDVSTKDDYADIGLSMEGYVKAILLKRLTGWKNLLSFTSLNTSFS